MTLTCEDAARRYIATMTDGFGCETLGKAENAKLWRTPSLPVRKLRSGMVIWLRKAQSQIWATFFSTC